MFVRSGREDRRALESADSPELSLAVVHGEVEQVGRGKLVLRPNGKIVFVALTRVNQRESRLRCLLFQLEKCVSK